MSTHTFTNAAETGLQAAMNIAGKGRPAKTGYRDPFSFRAEKIARQAILRADSLGMECYGPAPAPLDEKRDLYHEAIEELLDAIYYLCRQVAKLEDMRKRVSAPPGARSPRPGPAKRRKIAEAVVES